MSTITSPRDPPPSSPSSASARSSLTLERTNPGAQAARRNRAALRDYYNLKAGAAGTGEVNATSSTTTLDLLDPKNSSETDPNDALAALSSRDFNAQCYVTQLLSNSSLPELLGVEAALVGDIRGLDGERKALVYDNYSKLIAATTTIGRMSGDMGPVLGGKMEGLKKEMERVGTIVDGAAQRAEHGNVNGEQSSKDEQIKSTDQRQQKATVRYVLDTPRRLAATVAEGKQDDAEQDWAEVSLLLEKWKKVKGVKEIREQAIAALNP